MVNMEIWYESPQDGDRLRPEIHPPDEVLSAVLRIKSDLDPSLNALFGVDVVNDAGDRITIAFDNQEGFIMFDPADDQIHSWRSDQN